MSKAKLPIKTLITVLWLIAMGVILTTWHLVALFVLSLYSLDAGPVNERGNNLVFILLLGSILYIISGIFLSRRSKRAWIVAVTVLSIVTICSIGIYLYYLSPSGYSYYSAIPIIAYLVPLILLILDRKNYFEMVRQRELEKKDSEGGQSAEQR
jgi:hypothetical protein